MGDWAKSTFGKESFGSIGFIIAGTNKREMEAAIASNFDETISQRDHVYHSFLFKKGKREIPLVTNVYGAPAAVDVLAELYDGGVRTVLFVGYAYGGFKNHPIGTIVLPTKSYHFDGIYSPFDPSKKESLPDKQVLNLIKSVLESEDLSYELGINCSVPAVTFQLPHTSYTHLKPATVEMETAAVFSRAKDLGMRAAAILVISDNKTHSIGDASIRKDKYAIKKKVIAALAKHLSEFEIPPPKSTGFEIDSYLASVIHDPESKENVYKK